MLTYPRDVQRVRELVRLEHLASARLERAQDAAALFLDLVFMAGTQTALVPLIELTPQFLEARESSPFVWPADIAAMVEHEALAAIEEALLPWAQAHYFGGLTGAEVIRMFGSDDASRRFARARNAGFLAAAPYERVFAALEPYRYAARFAAGKAVHARDRDGAAGAAALSKIAASVSAALEDPQLEAFAREWFDLDVYGSSNETPDVTIVRGRNPVVQAKGEAEVRHVAPPVFPAAGGSSGRILLLVRDDFRELPDADTDQALLLAARLRGEGFTAGVVAAASAQPEQYDLLHCMCAAYPEQAVAALRRARAAGKPVVVTEPLDERDGESSWGEAIVPHVLRASGDEIALEDHLELLRRRRLDAPGVDLKQEPFPGYRALMEEVRSLTAVRIWAAAPAFLPPAAAADWRERAGLGPFVLAHAPLGPQHNQFALVRAAAKAGVPLVLAGPVADAAYAAHVRAIAAENVVFLEEPDLHEQWTLYAQARVYADVSWWTACGGRRQMAAAAGCATVFAPGVDPADEDAIAAALRAAWARVDDAVSAGEGTDPLTPVVQAYAQAAQACPAPT